MFIKYNGTNVHALPYITHKAVRMKNKKTGKVRIVQKIDNRQSPQEVHSLKPGWNQFPTHIWTQNLTSPSVQMMLKKKIIEVMSAEVSVKTRTASGKLKKVMKVIGQDDKPIKLKYFDDATAVKIVKETFDRDMLNEWLDEETRHKVKKVIAKQVEPLLNNNSTKDKDDDDFEDN